MEANFSVLQEPRGVMRVIQFIFSICAFATTCGFSGFILFHCAKEYKYEYEYPYNLQVNEVMNQGVETNCHPRVQIYSDFSSDAKFYVATGVIAMLYSLFILAVYTKFDAAYKSDKQIPLLDFFCTLFVAVLWLSCSAAWANSLNGMKHITDPDNMQWDNTSKDTNCGACSVSTGSFSALNISVILGFLNFFLWAADLWFLYKETTWFQGPNVAESGEI